MPVFETANGIVRQGASFVEGGLAVSVAETSKV